VQRFKHITSTDYRRRQHGTLAAFTYIVVECHIVVEIDRSIEPNQVVDELIPSNGWEDTRTAFNDLLVVSVQDEFTCGFILQELNAECRRTFVRCKFHLIEAPTVTILTLLEFLDLSLKDCILDLECLDACQDDR
jgi:hypothetical protein